MKVFLKNTALFLVLTLAFSALTGCNTSETGSVNNASPAPANSNGVSNTTEKSKVNYPPLPSAIMTSDVKALDGTSFKFEDKKGKVVLINLWATWCMPCIEEIPHLLEMQNAYRDKGFEIVGLDIDEEETREQIEAFAAKHKMNYQLGWTDRKLFTEIIKITRQEAIPQSLLINREGQLTGIFIGGGQSTISKMKETVQKIVNQ